MRGFPPSAWTLAPAPWWTGNSHAAVARENHKADAMLSLTQTDGVTTARSLPGVAFGLPLAQDVARWLAA